VENTKNKDETYDIPELKEVPNKPQESSLCSDEHFLGPILAQETFLLCCNIEPIKKYFASLYPPFAI
jgi:hypothetical protein